MDTQNFNCETREIPENNNVESKLKSTVSTNCQYVEIFFECDYAFYQAEGFSIINVENQVAAIFNEVQTIYFNESIPIVISEILVWTTPDPYESSTTLQMVLDHFKDVRGDDYIGQLAHLLTPRNLGGGLASSIGGLCSNNDHYSVSGSINTLNVPPFPDYSWNVIVVSHELGHNFGSKHTHNCDWSGGQIDDCGNVAITSNNVDDDNDGTIDEQDEAEGDDCFDSSNPILPINGGTIMSYCHTQSIGISFINGFGQQPGDKIRQEFGLATCYSNCNVWVDYNYNGLNQDGSFNNPWDTLLEGVNAVTDGGTIYIKSSIGDETLSIIEDKSFIIRSWDGVSVVGQ